MERIFSFYCILLCSIFTHDLKSQSITGTILDKDGSPVAFANVIQYGLPDTIFLAGATTDDAGMYSLPISNADRSLLKVSALGYQDHWEEVEEERENYDITLESTSLQLDEVVVTGRKALYELQQDRIVINVSASPSMSGNTALQLLQKSPGVVVNRQNESVSLNAKGEILIMINDKIQRVPTSVLLARLEGMQAEQIESIELIHQPSSRYDASGAAGIINIVLKENENQGTNGTAALTAGYGQREKFGTNVSLNSRKGIFNLYSDYTFNWNPQGIFDVNHYREYDYEGDQYYYQNLVRLMDHKNYGHSANLGLDISPSKSTVIGLLLSYANRNTFFNSSSTSNDFVNDTKRDAFEFSILPKTKMNTFISNVNLFQRLSENSTLNFDVDFARIDFDNTGDIKSVEGGAFNEIKADRQTPIDIWTFKLDNVNEFADQSRIELGVKATLSDIKSKATVQNIGNEEWVGNTLFSGTDLIQEQILAVYASYSKEFTSKINGELGLRFEHYEYELDAANDANDLEQVFDNLFPIARVNYKVDSLNTLQLTFNRTITRPSFNNVSAFFVFLDPSILVFGNPQLRPTFTNTYKISWQHRSIIFSLAYLKTINQIYYYNTVDKPNHIQTSSPNNLDRSYIFEANLSFPVYLTDWWDINWNLNLMHHRVEDQSQRALPFENELITFTGQINSSIQLGNGWSASFDGRYMTDYLFGDQEQFLHPFFNLGVRKQFKTGDALSLSIQDITNTSGKITWDYNQPAIGIRTFGDNNWSERQFRLTYSFNFGNRKLKKVRSRSTSSEEERNRLQ